ncbi:MAG TPA: type II toxin-antitoxin system prevent-host-death family antitoxin [Candidatus Acidoferrum sp.]|nr:type II toxin-antitoxin system prevent-host-death family antitoxin [Candidatus Acidoferrum sp.]
MEKNVSAADANRKFSELLRGVRKGRSYVVTSHGEPVAKLVPAAQDARIAAGARSALLARLKSQPVVKGAKTRRRWTRDELYEDGK